MTTTTRVFSARLYPRAAVEATATAFSVVCKVDVREDPAGTSATLELPPDAGPEIPDEFSNAVLAAAIEMHLGMAGR